MPKAPRLTSPRIIKIAFILLALLLSAAPSQAAAACACCADTGDWYERTDRMQAYEIDQLRRIRFSDAASLFLTEADDAIKGLPVDYQSFSISNFFKPGNALTLTFKGERGAAGSLVLFLPRVMTSFGVDMHQYPDGSSGPILYKEWRLEGSVNGSGIFQRGMARGTKFHLILQGQGNNCLSAEDFKNWRLQIKGPRASYAFYGSLKDPE
ncbi:MAG TPA: hypothetical protein VGO69_12160 [Pyrinomonadaceae bacterium]|nr:hypothetical protein [Pyrinomonadaceae bacterium]